MKKFLVWILPSLFTLLLSSCAADLMEVMKENKKSVGVLLIEPTKPRTSSGHLEAAGPTYIGVADEVDHSITKQLAGYDNHAKTFRGYGRRVVTRLKSQGIDAHLMTSYPKEESLDREPPVWGKVKNYPGERKKYDRYLVLENGVGAGVRGGPASPLGVGIFPYGGVTAKLFDSSTDQQLGMAGSTKLGSWIRLPSQPAALNPYFDEIANASREELLNETFYVSEE